MVYWNVSLASIMSLYPCDAHMHARSFQLKSQYVQYVQTLVTSEGSRLLAAADCYTITCKVLSCYSITISS